MNKLALSLLVGALLVPAVVCTVNAQENNGKTTSRLVTTKYGTVLARGTETDEEIEEALKKHYEKEQPALELRNAWREKDLELANTIGKIRFDQEYQEVMCSIVMALEKGGLEISSITEPGVITINSVRPRDILKILKMQKIDLDKIKEMNDKLEKIEEKFNSEVEKSGIDMEFMKNLPGYRLYWDEPMKITICVFQKYANRIRTQAVSENRYSTIEEKVMNGTAVNMFFKTADNTDNVKNWVALYPGMVEECYKKLTELFVQEGLTVQKD